tara:strand:+ start:1256 stop:2362 length:1107 start_codon:yes stop_codon:yes gene_type:complete
MPSILKFLTIFSAFDVTSSQLTLPGSQRDEHNCVLDGGYEWCESSQACQRPWEIHCEEVGAQEASSTTQTHFCPSSNIQMCRMMCPELDCGDGECAMRQGNCCDYTCENIREEITQCSDRCPPPAPCPMPMVEAGCRYVPPIPDNCGCNIGCGTIDCSTQPKIMEGGTCGGYMPYGLAGICDEGLECVYSMGPMIADAPGNCRQICPTVRDSWGNCVEEGCSNWSDGCNTCTVNDNMLACTEKACFQTNGEAHCLDSGNVDRSIIPNNCVTWYDGCNTCSAYNGELQGCTLMMCFTNNEPYCQVFTSGKLNVGEICYRFCEDNSQNQINRRDDCPKGTECSGGTATSTSMISFDSCSSRAHTCNIIGH